MLFVFILFSFKLQSEPIILLAYFTNHFTKLFFIIYFICAVGPFLIHLYGEHNDLQHMIRKALLFFFFFSPLCHTIRVSMRSNNHTEYVILCFVFYLNVFFDLVWFLFIIMFFLLLYTTNLHIRARATISR